MFVHSKNVKCTKCQSSEPEEFTASKSPRFLNPRSARAFDPPSWLLRRNPKKQLRTLVTLVTLVDLLKKTRHRFAPEAPEVQEKALEIVSSDRDAPNVFQWICLSASPQGLSSTQRPGNIETHTEAFRKKICKFCQAHTHHLARQWHLWRPTRCPR